MSTVLNFAIKNLKHAAPSKIVKNLGTSLLIGYLVQAHLKLEKRLTDLESKEMVLLEKLNRDAEKFDFEAQRWVDLAKEIVAIRNSSDPNL
ncbi:hypothetical protein C5167_029353 [Papaver somniferum]|nr:hypothetical protein C5167_029353 [Papaver somniferum]